MTSVFINNTNFLKNTGLNAGGGAAISTFFAQISYSDFLENVIDGTTSTFSGGGGLAITNLGHHPSLSPPYIHAHTLHAYSLAHSLQSS